MLVETAKGLRTRRRWRGERVMYERAKRGLQGMRAGAPGEVVEGAVLAEEGAIVRLRRKRLEVVCIRSGQFDEVAAILVV